MKQLKIMLLFLLISTSTNVHSQTISWNGGGGDNIWSNAANWDLNVVPSDTDEVEIDGGVNVVIPAGFEARVSRVNILDATLTIAPTAFLEVKNDTYGVLVSVNATLTNNGTIEARLNLFHGIRISSTTAKLYNNGIIHINNTTEYGVLTNGFFNNNGHLNIGPNIGKDGVFMSGFTTFQNTTNGHINILGVGSGSSGFNKEATQNTHDLENEGIICINDVSGGGGENIDSGINYSGSGVVNTSGCVATPAPPPIPTLSQWGLINLALLLMICGTLVLIRQEKGKKWNLV